jgi:hypothetical protein
MWGQRHNDLKKKTENARNITFKIIVLNKERWIANCQAVNEMHRMDKFKVPLVCACVCVCVCVWRIFVEEVATGIRLLKFSNFLRVCEDCTFKFELLYILMCSPILLLQPWSNWQDAVRLSNFSSDKRFAFREALGLNYIIFPCIMSIGRGKRARDYVLSLIGKVTDFEFFFRPASSLIFSIVLHLVSLLGDFN